MGMWSTDQVYGRLCSNAAPWRGALDKWVFTPADASFPIQVDEDAHTVVVQGGVQTRVLLDFLAKFMCALHLHL